MRACSNTRRICSGFYQKSHNLSTMTQDFDYSESLLPLSSPISGALRLR